MQEGINRILEISEIRTYSDFLSLEDTWTGFLAKCSHNIFSTWAWLSIWWKYYRQDKMLLILVAKDRDEIVGIAPLMYCVEKTFGLRLGKISLIGTPHADYNDFLTADRTDECIQSFIGHLRGIPENWRCIELTDIPENAKSLAVLSKMWNNSKLIHPCPYALLPDSSEKLLKGPDGKSRFTDVNRHFKALQKSFNVEIADCSRPDSFEAAMHVLFKLHQSRWASQGLPGAFAGSTFRSFHLEVARAFAMKGWLGLFLLKLSGNPVAALYGFRYNSKYYLYLTGFNPKYAKYGVGSLLITSVMQKCIDERMSEFDFMRGDEAYKTRWASSTRWNRHVIITDPGILARTQYWVSRKYWNRGKELKTLLKLK